jgi:hypothetical protein
MNKIINQYTFCIITPSYALDFERCQILCWSIDKFVSPNVNHYIVVDRRDYQLFSQLAGQTRKILIKESILPWWIKQVPCLGKKNFWLNYQGFPLRGWLVQQIIKLSAANYTSEDILVFIDSDVGFVRPFNLHDFIQQDKVRLFTINNAEETKDSANWDKTTNHLLGLSQPKYFNNYVGQIITWRRDNLLRLYQHIEKSTGQKWVKALCNSLHLSEYHLYGNFVNYILKSESGHYDDDSHICHQYWDSVAMSEEQLKEFFQAAPSSCSALMISAKSDVSISQSKYLDLLDFVPKISKENYSFDTSTIR